MRLGYHTHLWVTEQVSSCNYINRAEAKREESREKKDKELDNTLGMSGASVTCTYSCHYCLILHKYIPIW